VCSSKGYVFTNDGKHDEYEEENWFRRKDIIGSVNELYYYALCWQLCGSSLSWEGSDAALSVWKSSENLIRQEYECF
jgi:hypothetical protein